MNQRTAIYYDRLSTWTWVARWLGYGGGYDTQTVHRALADPRADGRATPTRVHDLLIESLPPLNEPHVLDAGCGMGGTMLDLASRLGGEYIGVTLSESQAAAGRQAVARAGLSDRVRLLVQSYDEPLAGSFDLIVAIESLAHSADPATTIATLSSRLTPRGVFAVIDDMPILADGLTSSANLSRAEDGERDLLTFKRGWRCPILFTKEQFRTAFETVGLCVRTDRDLTPQVRPRTLARISSLERLNRLAYRLTPGASSREMLDSYHGGLALERLYRHQKMSYTLLVAGR